MGLFDLLRKKKPATNGQSVLEWDEVKVACHHPNGEVQSVEWAELSSVCIRTTSQGPVADDIFWVLEGVNGSCVVPSETPGIQQLIDRLGTLPGFDWGAMIKAMCCADDAVFPCWKRK